MTTLKIRPRPSLGWFDGATHVMPVRAYFEDSDAGGIVYHANYLNFAEQGRGNMLRLLGVGEAEALLTNNVGWAIRRAALDFLKTTMPSDELEVRTSITKVGNSSVLANQHIVRMSRDDDSFDSVCDIDITLVCIKLDTHRPVRIPADVREAFASLQAGDITTTSMTD